MASRKESKKPDMYHFKVKRGHFIDWYIEYCQFYPTEYLDFILQGILSVFWLNIVIQFCILVFTAYQEMNCPIISCITKSLLFDFYSQFSS